ncbi:conserved hypothetical protein [Cenarchaeum symbiosum A]|uniref:PLD phosphodiesterase domain-containing protein n=1 Tax=Cenarchaeum symbiosum (strain A) TaxID=414004 RepID=A0RY28_CENSY|nr:conserved hypothetical protein [Cenarchaeum symbiosum A]
MTRYNIGEVAGIYGDKAERLVRIISDPMIDDELVYSVLTAWNSTKTLALAESSGTEIIWTGPSSTSSGTRNTEPVIVELLKSAKRGERVLIVGYRITHGAASIIQELNSCLKTGILVDLVVDSSSVNDRELSKCFPKGKLMRPTIYARKEKDYGKYKMHAKVIVVGRREMLVGSANLTGLGTEVNFELGLLVRGPAAGRMADLIDGMIKEEYFVRIDK